MKRRIIASIVALHRTRGEDIGWSAAAANQCPLRWAKRKTYARMSFSGFDLRRSIKLRQIFCSSVQPEKACDNENDLRQGGVGCEIPTITLLWKSRAALPALRTDWRAGAPL
jgi:hypothetical protein